MCFVCIYTVNIVVIGRPALSLRLAVAHEETRREKTSNTPTKDDTHNIMLLLSNRLSNNGLALIVMYRRYFNTMASV